MNTRNRHTWITIEYDTEVGPIEATFILTEDDELEFCSASLYNQRITEVIQNNDKLMDTLYDLARDEVNP